MEISPKKRFNKRKFVSVGLCLSLIILIITAILIQFFEDFEDSVELHFSIASHAFAGVIFAILIFFHLILNWQSVKSYMMRKELIISKETVSAFVLIISTISVGCFLVYIIMN
jgi:cytochrome b subunit of formate dehydrogenase